MLDGQPVSSGLDDMLVANGVALSCTAFLPSGGHRIGGLKQRKMRQRRVTQQTQASHTLQQIEHFWQKFRYRALEGQIVNSSSLKST